MTQQQLLKKVEKYQKDFSKISQALQIDLLAYTADEKNYFSYPVDKQLEDLADSSGLLAGFILDKLQGKQRKERGSKESQIRKVLGYTDR